MCWQTTRSLERFVWSQTPHGFCFNCWATIYKEISFKGHYTTAPKYGQPIIDRRALFLSFWAFEACFACCFSFLPPTSWGIMFRISITPRTARWATVTYFLFCILCLVTVDPYTYLVPVPKIFFFGTVVYLFVWVEHAVHVHCSGVPADTQVKFGRKHMLESLERLCALSWR